MRDQGNQRFLPLAVFSLCFAALAPFAALAQPAVQPGCDPQYMDALEAKAWMTGQRRVAQNQNLILKPDSVLEYSCFNRFVEFLGHNPGRKFSEYTAYWTGWTTPYPLIDTASLDRALQEQVMAPLLEYLDLNFDHSFLGGRAVPTASMPSPYGVYDCVAMQHVWQLARCMDFMEDTTANYYTGDDDFYDFTWFINNDPRRLPAVYPACTPPATEFTAALAESYRAQGTAHGTEYQNFSLATDNNPALDAQLYDEDPLLTSQILDLVLPGECSNSALVPTGIRVNIPGQTPGQFAEYVCTIPGCSHDGNGQCIE